MVKQVHLNKEYVILEKDGIPIAAIMDVDEFEDYLELHDKGAQMDIEISNREYRKGKSRPAQDFFKELEQEEVHEEKKSSNLEQERMTLAFTVLTSSHFERLFRRLTKLFSCLWNVDLELRHGLV